MKRCIRRMQGASGHGLRIGAAVVAMACSASAAHAVAPQGPTVDPTLALVWGNGEGFVETGDVIVVEVQMRSLGKNAAAGFQAFLEFDDTKLSFVSGTYTAAPFGLSIRSPIAADGVNIDLASGIDVFNGQTPTSDDAVLAELTFEALKPSCAPAVHFRKHNPESRLTTDEGEPILPLVLQNPIRDCACDWNCDGVLNSQDFFDYVADFFDLSGEFNNDGVLNSQDFFDFVNCFLEPPKLCLP